MRKVQRYVLLAFLLTLCLVSGVGNVCAAQPVETVSYVASTAAAEDTSVMPQLVDGTWYLFLPSSADLGNLSLCFEGEQMTVESGGTEIQIRSGEPFDLTALFAGEPEEGEYPIQLSGDGVYLDLTILRSANLRSMYITSANEEKDREWVEQDKENKAKDNAMVLLRADGSLVYEGTMKNIKGRGNSTWAYPQKPYQIKLKDEVDLLETGDAAEAESTWILLANYGDGTLIRNSITYDLAAELGMAYSPNCEFVDLYYDGEYRGTYLLSEKTEVGTGRVNIPDLEKEIEDANPSVEEFDDLATEIKVGQDGNEYQYVTGLDLPETYSGGYLLEMDFTSRAKAEKSWFETSSGQYVVCKSPEYLPEEAVEYIRQFYQEFEDAVFNGGVHPTNGRSYESYVDVESLAKHYLILELAQNGDAFQSSTYFYKPADENKLYAGPVWDYDSSYGDYFQDAGVGELGFVAGRTSIGRKLLSIASFREAIQKVYEESLDQLVRDVLLGDADAAGSSRLRSVFSYAEECSASQKMNHILWQRGENTYDETVEQLRQFLAVRNEWLYSEVMSRDDYSDIAAQFADVPSDAWYVDSVAYVVNEGLFTGTSSVLFSPYEELTRGMAVTVLYRMAGQPEVEKSANFSDVEDETWYTNAVCWAVEAGISEGAGNGVFGVEDKLLREELVLMFYRYAKYAGMNPSGVEIPEEFGDRTTVFGEVAEAFGWAIEKGIVNGVGGTQLTLAPTQTTNRAQAAAIIQRYYKLTTG